MKQGRGGGESMTDWKEAINRMEGGEGKKSKKGRRQGGMGRGEGGYSCAACLTNSNLTIDHVTLSRRSTERRKLL